MRAFKKTILMYLSIIYALIICVSGLCACNNGNEPQKPDDSAENSYFLQKVEISGNDKIRTGGTTTLSATASARTGAGKLVTSTEGFTYLSSDETIATVNENGIVSGHKEGVCDITVKHEEFNAENKFNLQVVSTVKLDFASGSGINTFGRTQIKDGQLLFVNALSGFEVNFDGTELKGVFNSVTQSEGDKNYILVETDVDSQIIEIAANKVDTQITLVTNLTSGVHRARVYKLTDGKHSSLRLISLSADISYVTAPKHSEPRITVYGDELTSGYGLGENMDASKSYAFLAAKEVGADLDIMSSGDVTVAKMKDVWNHYSPDSQDVCDNVDNSDYIIINLGENDGRLIKESSATVSEFIDDYKQMISSVRNDNRVAAIICCYGMTANSSVLAQSVKKVVKQVNDAGDKKVYALQLERCDGKAYDSTKGYPNAYGHEVNALRLREAIVKLEADGNTPSLQDRVDYDTQKEDISVILLGGQSNMEGNSWWKYLEGTDDRYNDYLNGFDGIKMSFANHESEANKTPSFNPVKLGYGGARAPGNGGDSTTCFGPEIGMAKTLHDNGYDNKVVFIKFAVGATYFHNDPNNRTWQAKTGTIYKAFIQYVDSCIAELSLSYNVSLDAMCWMQGESDTEQQAHVNAYKSNLNNFVGELRKHYSEFNPDFMFYDAYINWPKEWQGDRPEQINDIKKQLADENLHYEIIDTLAAKLHSDNEPHGSVDLAHFDAESEIRLGEMFAEAYMKDFPLLQQTN